MGLFKRQGSSFWWYRFKWMGTEIRASTHTTNKRTAEQIEASRRTELAKSEVGIRPKKKVPTLKSFIEGHFQPYIEKQHSQKSRTVEYYLGGIRAILGFSGLATLRLDEIRQEHVTAFVAKLQRSNWEVSTVNRKLEVLRRAFRLAVEWEIVEKAMPVVRLLSGEKRRNRVLAVEEERLYLDAARTIGDRIVLAHAAASTGIRAVQRGQVPAPPPDPFLLRDVAVILMECGLRPEECFRLRWDEVSAGTLRIAHGKTENARRAIPLHDLALQIIELRRAVFGHQKWVFPAPTKSGHIESSSIRKQHANACMQAKLDHFPIYTFRHTCLTRWAVHMDAYALAYLAGHSDFSTTRRYVHPQFEQVLGSMQKARSAQGWHNLGHSNCFPLDHGGEVVGPKKVKTKE